MSPWTKRQRGPYGHFPVRANERHSFVLYVSGWSCAARGMGGGRWWLAGYRLVRGYWWWRGEARRGDGAEAGRGMCRGAPGARAAPPPRVRTGTSGRTGTPRHAGTSCRARSVRGGARLTWVGRCGSGMWRSQSPRRVPCEGVRTLYRSGSFMIGGWGECARRESCEERVIGGLACRCGRDAACASETPQRTHLGRSALSPTPAPPAGRGFRPRGLCERGRSSSLWRVNQ